MVDAAKMAQEVGGSGRNLSSSASLEFESTLDLLRSNNPTPTPFAEPQRVPPPSAPAGGSFASRMRAGGVDLQQSLPGTVDPSPEMTAAPSPVAAPTAVEASPAKGPPRLPPLVPPPGTNQVHPAAMEGRVEGWERPSLPVDTDAANSENSKRISDLMTTLECPVCMDTADRAPIYQCPEGHLLCESCNGRLLDCPQCGHALMNARNRIAEDLAEKLQKMRGGEGTSLGFLPSHSLAISVSEPQKVRKWLLAKVMYQISTRIANDSPDLGAGSNVAGGGGSFSVTRDYNDIVELYNKLREDHSPAGVIVPPPPEKSSLAAVAVKVSGSADLNESVAGKIIERRCVALDRYLKRMARHGVIRKDPIFRAFIQEKEPPKELKSGKTFSEMLTGIKETLGNIGNKLRVSEHDPWFQTKSTQLSTTAKQLREMRSNLREMAKMKRKLHEATNDFRTGLVTSMLVGGRGVNSGSAGPGISTTKEHLAGIIDEVVDCHKTMSVIHEEQARADDLIVQLATDYDSMMSAADSALSVRRRKARQLRTVTKRSKKKKAEEVMNEIDDCQKEFDKLSQAVRRELEHFDLVMREEFEEAFSAYRTKYHQSMKVRDRVAEGELVNGRANS